MSAISDSEERACRIAPLLDRVHFACLFAVQAGKGACVDLPATPARQLQAYGLVVLEGPRRHTAAHSWLPAQLSPLGATVLDVLVLEGRQVQGLGTVKRKGGYLHTSNMQIVAACVDYGGGWCCNAQLSSVQREDLILSFPELRWS